ncbi:MAG: hypothetical protein KC486_22540 [Myxococcales bacterium]|nr:hypothetical protein [Myxococcales bacterium]
MPVPADDQLAQLSLRHLEEVVAIDSQSDESSATIPTTEGQKILADRVAAFHRALGATVERDGAANVIASYPGRGRGVDRAPIAFMVHLDTARGTAAVPELQLCRGWEGDPVPFPKNPGIRVDLATYPAMNAFAGHDLVHGPGDRPFGLDDKLGLAHCMTAAALLAESPELDRPPLLFIGRPDEEVGRDEAVVELAATLAERGVRWGYTVDGILPYEINVENFNAAMAGVTFPAREARVLVAAPRPWIARIGGVNTHGATAAAEGHRPATRLAAEWQAALDPAEVAIARFTSDALRDCDAEVRLWIAEGAEERVRAALAAVMEPHLSRGASYSLEPGEVRSADGSAEDMLRWVHHFLASDPGFTIAAEDSAGRDGYSQPFRARPLPEGGVRLDVRLRDFDPDRLNRRIAHVEGLAGERPVEVKRQYVNMGPQLAEHPGLAEAAARAGAAAGVATVVQPIRGGTGVDPFLARGIPIANLGTGYFAPESEKELTSLEMMAGHARWLLALIADLAEHGPKADASAS